MTNRAPEIQALHQATSHLCPVNVYKDILLLRVQAVIDPEVCSNCFAHASKLIIALLERT